ncbi:hypothetical protein [Pelagibius sp.]|uniref:hypothetical protein n=1 Tax=Pelagibius sp. TaxID=1931238 RepID=UPI003B507AC7
MIAAWLAFLSNIMLAVAALYVTGQALRGWYKEVQAEKLPEGPEREAMINDAKTFYALASLSKVWVLLLIFVGTLLRLAVGLYQGPWT